MIRREKQRAWFLEKVKIEDEVGCISVGGLAADCGMLGPETFLMMSKLDGEPVGTTSSAEDMLYYMRREFHAVRLLSAREAELAERCNMWSDCPYDDPEVGECPMHPHNEGY